MKNKTILVIVFFVTFLLCLNIKCYAGYQSWNSINYDVTLNSDSSMDVVETWDVNVNHTNTMLKNFELDDSKFSNITNVRVFEVVDNEQIPLQQIFEEQYHVDSGCYYALPLSSDYNKFEIAWHVGLDNSSGTRIYKLCYTIEDATRVYNDCTEFYWQFLGKNNAMSGKNITGTIKLPKEVSNIEKLRVWAHGPLIGEINRDSKDTVSFKLPEIPKNTMLEVRIVTEENIYENSTNIINTNKLSSILKEEKKWANSANFERNKPQIYYAILVVIAVIVFIYMLIKIIRYIKLRKLLIEKHQINVEPIEYFRQIPNEKTATPARAMYLYSFKNKGPDMGKYKDNIITAVLLDLSLRKVIRFETDKSGEIKIFFCKIEDQELIGEEYNVYDFLVSACNYIDSKREYITIKEFSDYAEQHNKMFHKLLSDIEYSASTYHSGFMNTDLKKELDCSEVNIKISKLKSITNWVFLFTFIFMIGGFSDSEVKKYFLMVGIIFGIILVGNIICVRILKSALNKMSSLTEKGLKEKNEWKALKKYMKDYSLLDEKNLPDIILWEKYLVYATAFGISKEVIEQLKIVHPDMFINDSNRDSYWNLVSNSRQSNNFLENLSNKIENTYRNSERKYQSEMFSSRSNSSYGRVSSSSGSGGGFSSGGGGRRTAEVAAVEDNKLRWRENMKTKNKIIYLTLFFVLLLLLFNVKSYAGTQSWNSLDYNVTVNSDGSMDVVETWNINISETNTLFKDFELDYKKYSGITDVKVSRVMNGEVDLTQIYEEQYYVDSGCYYALPLSNDYNKFEIAWNVGLDNSSETRTYKIYYTIQDAVKVYDGFTELYWQFLGTDNEITGKNITGTIKLPKPVSNIEKLRVWAHGPLEGEINRVSSDTVKFSVPKISKRTMLEVRLVTEENIYDEDFTNYYDTSKTLASILEEEQGWADEANAKRESAKRNMQIVKIAIIVVIILNIFIIFKYNKKVKEYREKGKSLEEEFSYSDYDIEYFREIPDEQNATPARALYMHDFKVNNSNITYDINKIFSATILDLSLKGLIEFEPLDKNEVRLIIKNNTDGNSITEDEKIIYNMLVKVAGTKGTTTVKEFEKYAKVNYDDVYPKLQRLQKIVEKYAEESGKIDSKRKKVSTYWKNIKNKYDIILVLLIVFPFTWPLFGFHIGIIRCIIELSKNVKKVPILSINGNMESKQWNALEKYMKEYSLLKEKRVPDIVLWEKFLVYATTFGISKEVIKQLKMVHPEMFNIDDTQNIHRYAYWYMLSDSRYGDNYFNNFNSGLSNIYSSASSAYSIAHSSSSSGSGSGGGFSGGGGGRRRWRRLWRSLKPKMKSEI